MDEMEGDDGIREQEQEGDRGFARSGSALRRSSRHNRQAWRPSLAKASTRCPSPWRACSRPLAGG